MIDSFYDEDEPLKQVHDMGSLAEHSRQLTWNHLRHDAKHFEYVGFAENEDVLMFMLQEMYGKNYYVSSIQKHCVSGIQVNTLGDAQCNVLSVKLRRIDKNDTLAYINFFVGANDPLEEINKIRQLVNSNFGVQKWIGNNTFYASRIEQ